MNIAIAGYGVEGEASYAYWKTPDNMVTIVDERQHLTHLPEGATVELGPGVFGKLENYDLVVRSPSINPRKLPYGDKVWSATNEFFAKCPAMIIGVTGTKGKGTTASIIASILSEAGKTVHLVGNIGVPALSMIKNIRPNDIVVYELSSFQLWDIKKSPHIAIIVMVEPDHLDIHDSLEDYLHAKAQIQAYQGKDDICLYHPFNQLSAQVAGAISVPKNDEPAQQFSRRLRYGIQDDGQVYVQDGEFYSGDRFVCDVNALPIVGAHNAENACAAISAVRLLGIENKEIDAGLRAFQGLPHRLKFVREVRGVRYFDDSIATTPGSAIAAIQSFNGPKVIILGGSNKGADFHELIAVAGEAEAQVIAVGQNGDEIAELCQSNAVQVERVTG
ncbi:MAG: UDP-N-acetylmuramoyl-L-alanine--D-glutamate ligase, partial [Candidatus Saccharimonadales bacterium]